MTEIKWEYAQNVDPLEHVVLAVEHQLLHDQNLELSRQVSALQTSQDNIINGLGIKGDGPYSQLVLEKFIALQAKCDALAAENEFIRDEHEQSLGPYACVDLPATKAAIAEIKAQGLDDLAEAWEAIKPEEGVFMSASTFHKYHGRALDVRDFAANLRAWRKG